MAHAHGSLAGKSILITGATSGIGEAAARVFTRRGARVVLVARREDRLKTLVDEIRSAGGQAVQAAGDVRDSEHMARAVALAAEAFGRLDAAFNNAGTVVDRSPLHLVDDSAFDTVMDTNVRGVWNCMRHEIGAMLTTGGGAIVNTSSVAGLVATSAGAPYIASKHAVIGLTKSAAVEYAAQGIRVNAIAPGLVRSEMTTDWYARYPQTKERSAARAPQARMAEPEEAAEAAAWLCSDEASFVTGATLSVDGGATTW
ncbi:SDR family NAD(P)-dependent oxidoreductase [Kitasatospora sp. LaBMicrA B282]|uniref:SDR family NAD(P)-dependent oxidoreductase n=1 Tax=Kitasatospora sp. LaBMicrA B282 TaxID=3420949 RepID=UPI003D0BC557